MEKQKIICSQCGKKILVEDEINEGFCLYCGTKFIVDSPQAQQECAEQADSLYIAKDWIKLASLVKNEKSGRLRIYKIQSRFHALFDEYINSVYELYKRTRPKAIIEMFSSKSSFGEDPVHQEFRDFVENCVSELVSHIAGNAGLKDIGGEAAADIAAVLLRKKNQNEPIYWPLVACEQFSIELIPFIPLDTLVELYNAYERDNPKNQALPNQATVKKVMRKEIEEKGGTLPKKGLFGGK